MGSSPKRRLSAFSNRAMVCECQWGLTCTFLGAFVILAAGVFTFFPVVLDIFNYPWYIALCWFWFLLGVAMLVFGILFQMFGWDPLASKTQAREGFLKIEDGGEA